jgi:hypothetical protein
MILNCSKGVEPIAWILATAREDVTVSALEAYEGKNLIIALTRSSLESYELDPQSETENRFKRIHTLFSYDLTPVTILLYQESSKLLFAASSNNVTVYK